MNKPLSLAAVLIAAVSLLAPRSVHAAEDGQLWEVSTHMDLSNIPELKGHDIAGMGDHTAKICRGADERKAAMGDMKKCKTSDVKESGTTVSMTFDCEDGKGSVKIVYNKARTEYHGSMKMRDANGHDVAATMEGKKIGACDLAKAKQERSDRHAQIERMKAQGMAAQAQASAYQERAMNDQIAKCAEAVETMDPGGLGYWGMCHTKKDATCEQILTSFGTGENAKLGEACTKKAGEFCKRYQTVDGFLALNKNNKFSEAEGVCGVPAQDLKPKLCKAAVKNDSYEFLAYNCPKDAKPLAKEHCAGRSYTSSDPRAKKDKWYAFCVAMAGRYMEGDAETAAAPSSDSSSSSGDEEADAKGAAKKAAKKAAVNALKGLFGR